MFNVVEFNEDGQLKVQVIPQGWLITDGSYSSWWPNHIISGDELVKLIQADIPPDPNTWEKYPCRLLSIKGSKNFTHFKN